MQSDFGREVKGASTESITFTLLDVKFPNSSLSLTLTYSFFFFLDKVLWHIAHKGVA